MSTEKLVDASLRFAQNRRAGDCISNKTYEQQKLIVSEEIEKTLDIFCPQDFNLKSPEVVLYPSLANDVEPFSILDEVVVHTGGGANRVFISEDLMQAVESCYGAYFDVTEQNDDNGRFDRQEASLRTASRIAAATWLYDSLDPRKVWQGYHENPIYLASLQAGILPKGEGSVEDAIDVARFRVIGAITRNGFQDDEKYRTFQATYMALLEMQIKDGDYENIAKSPLFGLRFSLVYACSDSDAVEMLDRMNNVNQVIDRYLDI